MAEEYISEIVAAACHDGEAQSTLLLLRQRSWSTQPQSFREGRLLLFLRIVLEEPICES
jgi:hypothetical protein